MAANSNTEDRGQFGSSLGFIMAAAGSAIGLGNIWRFPYLTGENGGGAFVFVYILCVVLIGLPLLFNEIALGRKSGKNQNSKKFAQVIACMEKLKKSLKKANKRNKKHWHY